MKFGAVRDMNSLSALMIARDDHDSALSADPKPRHHLRGFFKKIIEYQNDNEHRGMIHNHPSGDPTPSDQDIKVTRRLMDVGRSLDIEIVDHIVVTATRVGRVGLFGSIPADGPMVCTHVLSDNLVSDASGKPNKRALALENARREYRRRQVRGTMSDLADLFAKNDPKEPNLYGEPGWEVLIVLFIHHCEGKKIATVALASAALSPMTTVLRWINRLCDAGLTIKVSDPTDGRRHFVELTPFTLSHLEAYFSAVEG